MKDRILVINCGSSSVKVDVFSVSPDGEIKLLGGGIAERIGQPQGILRLSTNNGTKIKRETVFAEHESAILLFKKHFEDEKLFNQENGLAIGHRVVHGGGKVSRPVLIDSVLIKVIEDCTKFAPLHNPGNLTGIYVCEKLFSLPQVAVFDTAYHATIPAYAAQYALPKEVSERYAIRRYGFHGTSHEYVAREAAEKLNIPFDKFNCITLHLGNGASITAIENGKSVDTSMGFTPLEGLIMGTRCGDIDPAVVLYIQQEENLNTEQMDTLMNKKSGLLGLTGTNDMRDIVERAANGESDCKLALQMFCYRARKYLGAYAFALGRLDAIVFTAGIGENAGLVREKILQGLDNLGLVFDAAKNSNLAENNSIITSDSSPIKAVVVNTDEEKMIAQGTLQVIRA